MSTIFLLITRIFIPKQNKINQTSPPQTTSRKLNRDTREPALADSVLRGVRGPIRRASRSGWQRHSRAAKRRAITRKESTSRAVGRWRLRKDGNGR